MSRNTGPRIKRGCQFIKNKSKLFHLARGDGSELREKKP